MTSHPGSVSSDLEVLRTVVGSVLAGRAVRVFLFGSQLSGRALRSSDIDLAVLPLEPLPPGVLASLREAVEESRCVREVDVVDLGSAPASFRAEVEKEGVEWTF